MRRDTTVGLFAIVLGALYSIMTWQLPRASIGSPTAPLIFPAIIGGFMVALGVGILLIDLKKAMHTPEKKRGAKDPGYWKLVVGTLVLCGVYGMIFEHLGYMVSTLLFLMGLLTLVNEPKRWRNNIIITVVFTVGLWVIFVYGFKIVFPTLIDGGLI